MGVSIGVSRSSFDFVPKETPPNPDPSNYKILKWSLLFELNNMVTNSNTYNSLHINSLYKSHEQVIEYLNSEQPVVMETSTAFIFDHSNT